MEIEKACAAGGDDVLHVRCTHSTGVRLGTVRYAIYCFFVFCTFQFLPDVMGLWGDANGAIYGTYAS